MEMSPVGLMSRFFLWFMLACLSALFFSSSAFAAKATLSVSKSGMGAVSSVPAGITCGADCREAYVNGTNAVLTATPDAGYGFARWAGCTSTDANTCTVSMTANKKVTAIFKPLLALTVIKTGTGSGTVTSTPVGINCGSSCAGSYISGGIVSLKATAMPDSRFTGWSGTGAGACTSAANCKVTMTEAKNITARFDILLTVIKVGNGSVSSVPDGISCGADCSEAYANGASVTLTATPDEGNRLARWAGCASTNANTCTVSMTASKTVKAIFNEVFSLSVNKTGSGTGAVTGLPAGIKCGRICQANYDGNTLVTLKANPASNAFFMGWSGACSGTDPCSIVLNSNQNVTALFSLAANKGKYWVTGYLPGYNQGPNGEIAYMTALDWKTVTHVIHNAALPNVNGSLDMATNSVGPVNRQAAIKAAHDAGVPILFGIMGGKGRYQGLVDNPTLRTALIQNLLAVMDEGYDGLDIDFEPIVNWGADANPGYEAFINELHTAMQGKKTPLRDRPLLTIAVLYWEKNLVARLQDKLDQINIMAYDQSGTMQGITWHDSALYDGGNTYPSTGNPVMSVDYYLSVWLGAGIPASKLGLGVSLESRLWIGGDGASTGGVTAPMQIWTAAPKHFMTSSGVPQPSYAQLLDQYYKPENAYWDDGAKVPYLSFDNPGSANDMFISYNDERSVATKIAYMKARTLGGLMLWTLEKDYRPLQPPDKQRPIMQTIRQGLY
jgi:spore germination protein YaaH